MAENISYLKQLKFDKRLLNSFHAKWISNIRIIVLLIIFIVAAGGSALALLPRRLNPQIKLTIVTVVTVLPGAGPQDVESLVTIPLEDKLNGVSNLDTITSVSGDNFSAVTMQFLSSVDKTTARNDVQNAVNEVTTLPTDAQTPQVTALDFENQPVWTFALTTTGDDASLMRFAEDLQTKIKTQPNVDHVSLSGFETQEIAVLLDQAKIKQNGLNPLLVSQALRNSTQSFPAGNLVTDHSTFSLALDAQATSVDDIRNIQLTVQGQLVKLGDIATVQVRSKPNQNKTFIAGKDGKPLRAVDVSIFKTSSADIDKTASQMVTFVNDQVKQTNGTFQVVNIQNSGELISKQFNDLVGEFQSTLFLVFINLLLFLGISQALIAIMTIPLTFLAAFAWMAVLGQTINFLSLFALLLAFGTSIDDTIVTVSALTTYYRTKKFTPYETGLLVWRDFIVPIWTTTITTVWAFLPLILSSGIIGEFIKPIPIVVTATMYSSTAVAVLITLPLLIILLKPKFAHRVVVLGKILGILLTFGIILAISPKTFILIPIFLLYTIFLLILGRVRGKLSSTSTTAINKHKRVSKSVALLKQLFSHGIIGTAKISERYRRIIARVISSKRGRRTVLLGLLFFTIISYALVPLGLVKNEFFPKADIDFLYVNVSYPNNTNLETVETESLSLLQTLEKTPETEHVVVDIGSSLSTTGMGGSTATGNSTLFTLLLKPKAQRKTSSIKIADDLREKLKGYQKGTLSVLEESNGPPAGADVQIALLGDNLNTLDQYANKTEEFLKSQPGLINVDKSIKSGTGKISFIPDKAALAQNGVGLDTIGFWMRTYASGFPLEKVKFDTKDYDVNFYMTQGNQTPDSLGNLQIPTSTGTMVPLLSLGKLGLENNPTAITRDTGKRSITVSAGVQAGYSVSDANAKLAKFVTTDLKLPSGYTWKTGGVNEENTKSVTSIFQAMGLSFILIMATMVVEFRSFRQAAMILFLIPIAISGVFIVFGLTGTPLSFPALIGVLALFGIVVTNAMFIVEKINQNRKHGMEFNNAISDAAQSRLEPILLTSLTSILGLIPISIANPLWTGLGGAIISGLIFSGAIMLFYIPVMYYTFFKGEAGKKVTSL
ncbi:MAG TPA: efflux RND transporter permease subunit [Candidatus Saccharimonadia bacterium]|nr:efflux RND transporter permease subunit [Candidatus Saccharimonadia bacterium]